MFKTTRKIATGKPSKPYPDFPLFPHVSGRWTKKVRGKQVYFGKVADDPEGEAALAKWLEQRDDLLAGRAISKPVKFPLYQHPSGRWAKKVRGRHCYFGKIDTDPQGFAALAQWMEQKDDLLAGRIQAAAPRDSAPAQKPYVDFPLFRHAAGYWAKKIRGKTVYFGKIAVDPQGRAAIAQWLEQRDDLLAGREPPARGIEPPAEKPSPAAAKPAAPSKTRKPRKDFPLYPHATGYWSKKVHGKYHYFGKIADDPKGEKALRLWLEQKDELLAGRIPPARTAGGTTVEDICDQFMAHKDELRKTGEITERTYGEYLATGKRLTKCFGHKTPVDSVVADDFRQLRAAIAKHWGPVRLGNEIQRVRSVFKFAFEAGLIDRPPRYGADFKKPSAKVLRKARATRGVRKFSREELRAVLAVASVNAKAMILLGINGGLGNSDVGWLPTSAIDMKHGWLDYPRPKTGIGRRIPLWKETIEALKTAQAERHAPNDPAHEPLLFISRHGKSYTDPSVNGFRVGQEMQITMDNAKIDDKPVRRQGLSFYTLRHTFQTVAEGRRDLAAVQAIMGHAASNSDMSATYREGVNDERLKAVTDFVRLWLFERTCEACGEKFCAEVCPCCEKNK